ncbi:MAG: hypothetical protein CBC09_07465 [Cellvibrionales bacterium TMED49]|nr:hypothetical protein [Porticoccaceae bacterium]OUU37077.1 MAG: hypothetical protein CBC09_07465 [Cellvibrionales bacterium TMED49]
MLENNSAYKNPQFLISADELGNRRHVNNVKIFDTNVDFQMSASGPVFESGQRIYENGQISGAGFIDLLKEWSDRSSPLPFTVQSRDLLAEKIGQSGISNECEVILYSSGAMMWATRAWWVLFYAGHENIKVLNGSYGGWIASGGEVSSGFNAYAPEIFTPSWRSDAFSPLSVVESSLTGDACTLNALPEEAHKGLTSNLTHRKGHIPGSSSLSASSLFTGDYFLDAESLSIALDSVGALSAKPVITYCGAGIAATVDAFALKLMGKDDVSVFDGSLAEWAQDDARKLLMGSF